MKLKLVLAGLLTSSLAFADSQVEPPKSVSVLNLSPNSLELWVNGDYHQLQAGRALLYPCIEGEKVEIQVGMKLEHLTCGEEKEVLE